VLANTVSHVYLPYDLPCVIKRFLAVFKPKIAVFMEKEIWPNLYSQCSAKQIPLLIINARLSANSAKGYKKIPALVKPALASVNWLSTQTEEDKQRFIEIGAMRELTSAAGNLKFDLQIDTEIIQQAQKIKAKLFSGRFVWIIASTHEGEEKIFFELYPKLKKHIPELLLLVVPRHPERFTFVQSLAEKMRLQTRMRSRGAQCSTETDVYIADTMGELKLLYGSADISFVAGSMVPIGGHNILEPAVMNVPIMFGPHMINFKDIARNVLEIGAAVQCADKEDIIKTVLHLYRDDKFRDELVTKAQSFVKHNQGATTTIVDLIDKFVA
jgi:3-deoxy-D-manno-octulosonic-acid transferase